MSYHLKRKESVRDGVRRVARDQMERARDELTDGSLDSGKAVHQARKRFKKVRSLLRLVRPALGDEQYRAENGTFRDLGRSLAGPRDADVLVKTLDGLRGHAGSDTPAPAFTDIREHLVERRDAYHRESSGELAGRMGQAAAALAEAGGRAKEWRLDAKGFAVVGPGLKRAYKRGRKALGKAMKDPTDERFHELRKRVKDHWYHSRLLREVWAGGMECRIAELKTLSDLLGDDHDLAVLRATLEDLPPEVADAASLDRLCRLVDERQKHLRRDALPLACRVYAEKPKHLRRRINAYWETWRGW